MGTINDFKQALNSQSSIINGENDPSLVQSNYTVIGKDDINENEMDDKWK